MTVVSISEELIGKVAAGVLAGLKTETGPRTEHDGKPESKQ